MKRSELVAQQAKHLRTSNWIGYGWICFVIVANASFPSMDDLSAPLARWTGGSWLVVYLVGLILLSIYSRSRSARCDSCHRALSSVYGPLAVKTGRCGRCGKVAAEQDQG
jgi:hypothetical protein